MTIRLSSLKRVFSLALVLLIVGALLLYLPPKRVFGPPEIIVASSRDLSSILSLNERSCRQSEEEMLEFRYLTVKLVCRRVRQPCYVWYWDVANWTLIYTRENMMTNISTSALRLCPIPIHGERVAKIIQSDGNVEYPGCTNEKYPCAPMPLFSAVYDERLKQRINRSPCCRKLLVDITHHMARVFDRHNITYLLLFGSVISLVRDGGTLIPYDTDIDVGVDLKDLDKLETAIPDLQRPGYIFKWKMEYTNGAKRYMIGCTNSRCLTGPGIAIYSVNRDTISAPVKNWKSLPRNLTIPPIRRKFEGVEVGFPKEPVLFLDYYYGKDKWRTQYRCTKHYYGQCTE